MPEHTALIPTSKSAVPLYLHSTTSWADATDLPEALSALAKAQEFSAGLGQMVIAANADGDVLGVLFGVGDGRDALAVAALSAKAPALDYALVFNAGVFTKSRSRSTAIASRIMASPAASAPTTKRGGDAFSLR
ncbi:MAG: hypothetical protein AAGK93_07460 [Pseudomonadota bacterium]